MKKMHTIKEFEAAIQKRNFILKEIILNSDHHVKKAEGCIRSSQGLIHVHWDAFGICYVAKVKRYKNGDINFE